MITLQFTYSKQEFVAGVRQYLFATNILRKSDAILFPAALLLSSIYVYTSGGSVVGIVVLVLFCLVALFAALLYWYVPHRNYKAGLSDEPSYTLTFDSAGIGFNTTEVASQLGWEVYHKAIETSDFFFLVQDSQQYTILPKRAFASKKEQQSFRQLLQETIGALEQAKD